MRVREVLEQVAEGVWVTQAPVRFLGLRLWATMTVVRLARGQLLVHSPVALTPERRAAVEALGPVEHLYSPNLFHHLRLGDWSAAFPRARVHAPPGLQRKRPDLRIDRVHGTTPEPAFDGVIDELRIDGFRLEETALFVRPAKLAVIADLVHNIGRPSHWWTNLYSRAAGFYDRVAVSRVIRSTGVTDRVALRMSVDRVLACDFETLVVGHGAPVVSGARRALADAYGWCPPVRRAMSAGSGASAAWCG